MSGYFLVYRGLHDKALFRSTAPYSRFEGWLDLIEQANFSESSFRHQSQIYTIPRGSLGSSYRSLAKRWNWSVNRVIRELNLWQDQSMVVVQTEHGYLHITICNYESYQNPQKVNGTHTEQRRNTHGTVTDTNQKNIKKENNNNPPTPLPPWLPIPEWEAFKDMRKAIKHPLTAYAEKLAINKLGRFLHEGHDLVEILNQATFNEWKDLYPPKPQKGNSYDKPKSKYDRLVDVFQQVAVEREQGIGQAN